MKNNYWDGTPNPGPTDFQCFNRYKDHAISISVHVRYQCFLYAVIWENYHQSSKKSLLKKIDVQMAPIHLFLVILIVFIMMCTSWKIRNDTLFKMWDFVTSWRKMITGPKIAQGVELQALLLLSHLTPKCLINHIRNVPVKHLHSAMECLSFSYAVTENSDSKVVIVCFRKSYL